LITGHPENQRASLAFVRWWIALIPHRFSAHLDAMSVVHQTVEDARRATSQKA
jgi:hypothetical protein